MTHSAKAFKVGDTVMFQDPYTKVIRHDQIIYLSKSVVGGSNWDLSLLYERGKLTKVNK